MTRAARRERPPYTYLVLFNPPRHPEPRASLIPLPGHLDVRTEIWMGGADSLHGEAIEVTHLQDAWIIDLAGEMPLSHREAAALWLPRVFLDAETTPPNLEGLRALAHSIARAIHGRAMSEEWPHPPEAPSRIYVVCQHGMNRSGLVTGLILRALGLSAEEAIAAIASRPGALNNQTFAELVHAFEADPATSP